MAEGENRQPSVKTIHLDTPITFSGVTYEQIDLRELTWGEDRKARTAKSDSEVIAQAVSFVSGIPVPAIDLIPAGKVMEAWLFLQGFMPAGPQTGET